MRKNAIIILFIFFCGSVLYVFQNLSFLDKKAENCLGQEKKALIRPSHTKVLSKPFKSKKNQYKSGNISFLKELLKKSFPEIIFDIRGKCPLGFNEDKNSLLQFDISCSRNTVKNKDEYLDIEVTKEIELTYINDRFNSYMSYFDGAVEPIEINFYGPEEIKDINLFFNGSLVFSVSFSRNLVTEHILLKEELDITISDFIKRNRKVLSSGDQVGGIYIGLREENLIRGKESLELFLKGLCVEDISQACKAFESLKSLPFPFSKKNKREVFFKYEEL